jgi:hypothetical protein
MSGAPRLCDYAGCNQPATNYAQAGGENTPTKEWYGCYAHRALLVAPGYTDAELDEVRDRS